jgi:hypothetical protein
MAQSRRSRPGADTEIDVLGDADVLLTRELTRLYAAVYAERIMRNP